MNTGYLNIVVLAIVALGAPLSLAAEEPTREVVLSAAREVIESAGYANLITLDADGQPQARIMDPFPPEADLTVWMGTRSSTRKVAQLGREPRATLFYFDPAGPAYVTLVGRAQLVTDPAEKVRRFKKGWAAFYDDGPHGDDYVLIRFATERVEIVSIPHGIASGPKAWKPAVIALAPH